MIKSFDKEYDKLNEPQKKAVDSIDGPVIVIAGPGTGKTQLLSMRVANILKKTDVSAENILCLTFTDAAAENMRQRINNLVGPSANKVQVFTFHGFGTNVIQQYPEYFYDRPALIHLDDLGEYELLQNLMSKLPHTNPLSKKVGESFLHLVTVMRTISWIKQAGLKPDELRTEFLKNKSFFKSINKHLDLAFSHSPSPKHIAKYEQLADQIDFIEKNEQNQFGKIASEELHEAIKAVDVESRYAKSITQWRNNWLSQYRVGKWRFADQARFELLADISNLYENYQGHMTSRGLYTFDDMILRTYQAVNESEELKLTLQERYQYVLVDEYQDTNGVQEKLLNELGNNPVNENRPNLMVVGDDDQAIYRFQGAKNSVMKDFIERWRDPQIIVLSDSYRSGKNLLDLSKNIISLADNRLENIVHGLTKKLDSNKNTRITKLHSVSEGENYINTARFIADTIKSGIKPSTIAVISPKHKFLEALVPYLVNNGVPINYERREQILNQPRIVEILDLVELLVAVSKGRLQLAETILSRILAAEYWKISTTMWWEIAVRAQKEHRGWLRTLSESNNKSLSRFAEAIKVLGKESLNQPFGLTMAQLLGNKSIKLADGSYWSLPWRDYYFSKSAITKNPSDYLKFIGQFDSLNLAFSEWLPAKTKYLTINDFDRFITLYKKSGLSLLDTSPYLSAAEAITLTTVYKSKGLEWDNVFILNAQENVWGTKTRSKNLSFRLPSTMRWIEPGQNDDGDLMRLLYVALTRAKTNLYITSFETSDNGKASQELKWLKQTETNISEQVIEPQVPKPVFIESYEGRWRDIYTQPTKDLNTLLKPALSSYRLSATHLNDFLAIDMGGPQNFLFRHLLKVPDVINPNAMYGDAVHKSLEYMHKTISSDGVLPKLNTIQDFFSDKLRTYPLSDDEYKLLNQKGRDNLRGWVRKNKGSFTNSDISERNFFSENIQLGNVRLTGKIDLIRPVNDSAVVLIDYKTSKPLTAWSSKNQLDNLRAYTYQRQLLFYKLLVDNSSLAKKYTVNEGMLDFLTADDNKHESLSLHYSDADIKRLVELIKVVWDKITNLDLPSADNYPATLAGIKSFEDDLLSHKI